ASNRTSAIACLAISWPRAAAGAIFRIRIQSKHSATRAFGHGTIGGSRFRPRGRQRPGMRTACGRAAAPGSRVGHLSRQRSQPWTCHWRNTHGNTRKRRLTTMSPAHETRAMHDTLLLFGATGDLAQRYLFPSLLRLLGDGLLPEDF